MVQNVVMIGAGPAGLLLAHYLLRQGNYHIDIYERRPDPRLTDVSSNRTFPISLQERGRKALRAIVGLEEAIAVPDAYKSVFLSRINPSAGIELEPNKIHAWNLNNKTRMLMVPQPGDQLHGVIIFDAQKNPLEGLSTKEEVKAFFQEKFPLFGQLMSLEEAAALLKRPVARVLTVRCDRFHEGDSVLLIGDAAHAVSPAIGQGCNSSLEDVLILGQLLEQYGDDWGKVLSLFSTQRVPDAHALRELSDYLFPRKKLLVTEFFLRLTMRRLFHQWFPDWVQPFVFDLVLDTDLPYSQVLRLSQDWINKVKRSMVEHS